MDYSNNINNMPIQWKDEYVLGIKVIDDQHQKFIEIIDNLNKTLHAMKPKEAIKETIEELDKYSKYHIKTEENYFKKFNYKGSKKHIEEHEKFLAYIKDLKQQAMGQNDYELAFKLLDYLGDWLIVHEQGIDRQYVSCFKKNGL